MTKKIQGELVEPISEKKRIGSYTIKMSTRFDKTQNPDLIYLSVGISKDLQEVIKSITLKETQNSSIPKEYPETEYNDDGDRIPYKYFQRHKIMKPFYNALYGNFKEILFLKDIIKTGKVEIGLRDFETVENTMNHIKENVKSIIRNHTRINQEVTVDFDIKEREHE